MAQIRRSIRKLSGDFHLIWQNHNRYGYREMGQCSQGKTSRVQVCIETSWYGSIPDGDRLKKQKNKKKNINVFLQKKASLVFVTPLETEHK